MRLSFSLYAMLAVAFFDSWRESVSHQEGKFSKWQNLASTNGLKLDLSIRYSYVSLSEAEIFSPSHNSSKLT